MKFSHKIPLCRNAAPLLLLLFVAGCLMSPNPFYNESDIVQGNPNSALETGGQGAPANGMDWSRTPHSEFRICNGLLS
jgi:hypothetical protein